MVYKKYIKRGSKIFGPYYYRSVKKDGKVITQYVKNPNDFPKKKFLSGPKKNLNKFLILPIIFLILIAGFFIFKPAFTGKVILSVEDIGVSEEALFGNLKLNLEPNEFIPASTNVLIENGEEKYEFLLQDLIDESSSQGEFYILGTDISGFGEGYGVREKDLEVSFVLEVLSKEENKVDQEVLEKNQINESESENESEEQPPILSDTEINSENSSVEAVSESPDLQEVQPENSEENLVVEGALKEEPSENVNSEVKKDEKSEKKEEQKELKDESEIIGNIVKGFFNNLFLTITGKTSLETIDEVSAKVSKDKPFIYALEEGQTAEIINSYPEGHKDKKVNLEIINNTAVVTTDYLGEGAEYLINLSELSIPVKDKILKIKLVYNGTEFYSLSENLNFEILNETNQTIQEVNFTADNSTIQYGAVLGEPVKWKQKIIASEQDTIVELPKQAENISVFKIENSNVILNDSNVSLENSQIIGNLILEYKSDRKGFFSKVAKFITGRVIEVTEKTEKIEVNISEDGVEYEIEYITPAPISFEKNTSVGKEVVISSEVHYENVLAYTSLPKKTNLEEIKLYQIVDSSKIPVDFIAYNEKNEIVESNNDLDDDVLAEIEEIVNQGNETGINKSLIYGEEVEDESGYSVKKIRAEKEDLVSYIEWIVPSLSNQTYELILITKAQHLDSNKNFISDIYEEVKALDGNWSEQINDSEYVRVTFEKNLTNENDITIYAKPGCEESILINGIEVPCEIYEKKMRIDAIRRMMK